MFRKFQVTGVSESYFIRNHFNVHKLKNIGKEVLEDYRCKISPILNTYIKTNGNIDAAKLEEDWFPKVKADIFISHSHMDEDLALILAGFLMEEFQLRAFVWGNSIDVQRQVDKSFRTSDGYHYDTIIRSTTYIHMLLSTALTKVMDKVEALFLLNNPHSINSKSTTSSAWIYHEILTSNFLRVRIPERYAKEIRLKMFSTQRRLFECRNAEGYKFDFDLDLSTFYMLDSVTLKKWRDCNNLENALDRLYSLYGSFNYG
jgi:hypothetical protein